MNEMTVKERILAIRLMAKIEKNPGYAERIGLEIVGNSCSKKNSGKTADVLILENEKNKRSK
ncbi:MAG: hypothetical protein IJD88_07945 [Clostridia bacterium]|nr:hypothetical protein [Clostridia bacterium]